MPSNEAGLMALAHLDAALAKRPEKDDDSLTAALRCLGAFRNGLAAHGRRAALDHDRSALDLANAVISVVMAAQYPLGELPWAELATSRGWLAEALARTER